MRKTVRKGIPVVGITGEIVASDDAWVYRWFGIDCTSKKDVQDLLPPDGSPVIVEIDSPGGSVVEGAAIYTELMNYPGELTLEIPGLAASAASVIAQAKAKQGAKCRISPVALMMTHNVQMGAEGDYRDMEKAAGILKTANQSIINAYCLSTGKSREEVAALLDAETWFSAQEAVESGLADEIMFLDGLSDFSNIAGANVIKAQARTLVNRAPVLSREAIEKLRAEHQPTGNEGTPPKNQNEEAVEKARAMLALERARY